MDPVSKQPGPVEAEKVERPHDHFANPADVVVTPELSKDQKVRALDNLEQDARQLSTASAEGMTGGRSGLDEVLVARDALDLPPFDLAVSVVLQGFRARLPAAAGSESHALIVRAIEAVEAAAAASKETDPANPSPP